LQNHLLMHCSKLALIIAGSVEEGGVSHVPVNTNPLTLARALVAQAAR